MKTVAVKDGSPLCVLRPDNARDSVNIALRAAAAGAASMPTVPGGFTFVGWLSTDGHVIDGAGEVCGELVPGDHLGTFDTPEEMAAAFGVKL